MKINVAKFIHTIRRTSACARCCEDVDEAHIVTTRASNSESRLFMSSFTLLQLLIKYSYLFYVQNYSVE